MHSDTTAYNASLQEPWRTIADRLASIIDGALPDAENKIWHRHPVWFLNGNPIVGYSLLKSGIRLLFWSGQSFASPGLTAEGTFKAAESRYGDLSDIDETALRAWLTESRTVQWDYKNLVKRKGKLERLP